MGAVKGTRAVVRFNQITKAAKHFDEDIVQHTPTDRSRSIGREIGADIHLKMEHLQRTGSFKTRGAFNKMRMLQANAGPQRIVAASAGNHAQGVALTATNAGFDATIVMPTDAPQAKINATRGYGAEVILHGSDFQAAMKKARELATNDGTEFIHAYDDPAIIAGQGTIGLEVIEDVPDVDTILVPIGGGGLIAGIGCAIAELAPSVRVLGVQAASAATVPTSLQKGHP